MCLVPTDKTATPLFKIFFDFLPISLLLFMYHVVYGFLYLFSLLPLFFLYIIGDGVYLIVYYLIGYRKKVVMHNLSIAFPEKSEAEKIKIAKQFYRNFTDTFIET